MDSMASKNYKASSLGLESQGLYIVLSTNLVLFPVNFDLGLDGSMCLTHSMDELLDVGIGKPCPFMGA